MGAFLVGIIFGVVGSAIFVKLRAERARKQGIAPRR